MPCLEVILPKSEDNIKEKLTYGLTKAFDESTRFGADIFGIHYSEYEPKGAASGGVIWDGRNGRPYLHLILYCPRIDRQTKQKLVETMSAAFVDAIGKENWLPVIHICEHPYDNVGVKGQLLSDTYEELAKKKFYYELADI